MRMVSDGRRPKLNADVQQKICDLLRAGNTFRSSCEVSGVSENAGLEWRARGEGRDPDRLIASIYAEFAKATRKAEQEAAVRNVALIQDAATKGTWTASAWWLERKFPADWARVDRYEHTGRAGGPIQVEAVTPESRHEAIVALARELRIKLTGRGLEELGYALPSPRIAAIDVHAVEPEPESAKIR